MTGTPSPLVARFIRRYNSAHAVGGAQAAGHITACAMCTARGADAPR